MDPVLLHRWTAIVAGVAVALLALAAVVSVAVGRPSRAGLDRLVLLALGGLALASIAGIAVLVAVGPPTDGLHLLYAVLAPGAVVLGRAVGGLRGTRGRLWLAGAAAVGVGLVIRLFLTAG
jgi:hypothetical protein